MATEAPPAPEIPNLGGSDGGVPPAPEIPNLDGGDGDGGGSSGGGGEPKDPLAGYRSALLRLRINPAPYIQLMQQAAAGKWTADEFMWALESDPRFQKSFPGINALLDQGMSVPTAVGQYRRMYSEWSDGFKDAGLAKVGRLTPHRFGMYMTQGVDLEEALFRVSIIKQAKDSEPFRKAFNLMLKKRGRQELDKQGWARFLAGRGDQSVYDLYEGALLFQELGGEGLKVKDARRLAKVTTSPEGGPAFTAAGFAEAIWNIQRALGTELIDKSGLGAKGLALAALKDQVSAPGARRQAARAFAQLEQMLANQEAQAKESGREPSTVVAGRPVSELAPR